VLDLPATLGGLVDYGAGTTYDAYGRVNAAGNMSTRTAGQGSQTLTWSDAGQLTAITGGTGGTGGDSHFVYAADGTVLLQKDPGASTLYLAGEQITLNTATQATAGVRYYSLPGGSVAYRTGAGTAYRFEITDQHGTAGLTLDSAAQIPTWRRTTCRRRPCGRPLPRRQARHRDHSGAARAEAEPHDERAS